MFPTILLDRAIERENKVHEELRRELLGRLLDALDRLACTIPFKEAYIFGSIAVPFRFRKGSDVDIGFMGLDDGDFFKAMSFISGEIGVDVDVVQLEGHRLADKIKREGIRWKKKDLQY